MRHPDSPENKYGGSRRRYSLQKYANAQRATVKGKKVRMLTASELEELHQRMLFIFYGERPPPDSLAADRCRPKPKKWEE